MSKVLTDQVVGVNDSELVYLPWKTRSHLHWYEQSSGTSNSYDVDFFIDVDAYQEGMKIYFQAHQTNTGPAQVNVNNLGYRALKTGDKLDLEPETIIQGALLVAYFDGTDFLITHMVGQGVSYGYGGIGAGPQAPTADFTVAINGQLATFTNTSTDPDGVVIASQWSFGDGDVSTQTNTTHMYQTLDEYNVTLTVTDNSGQSSSKSVTITIDNYSPSADFTYTAAGQTVTFTNISADGGAGTIVSHSWNFGDGQTSTDVSPQHSYASAGTYDVTLTVTDDDGAWSSIVKQVSAAPDNVGPTANFSSTNTGSLQVGFNASSSSDPDGTIVSYHWAFGDGTVGSGVSPSHTYASGGAKSVTLTVTDDDGATGSITKSVTPSENPTAAFTYSVNNNVVTFTDASSAGAGSSITSRSWSFGDGQTSGATNPVHTYSNAGGNFSVTLTVTNNAGLTHSVTQNLVLYGPITNVQISGFVQHCDTGCPYASVRMEYQGGPSNASCVLEWASAGAPNNWSVVGTYGATNRVAVKGYFQGLGSSYHFRIASISGGGRSWTGPSSSIQLNACPGGPNDCP